MVKITKQAEIRFIFVLGFIRFSRFMCFLKLVMRALIALQLERAKDQVAAGAAS